MRAFKPLGVLGLVLLLAGSAFAQAPPDQDLQKRVQDLEKQVQELKELLKKKEKPAPEGAATKEELSKLEKKVEALKPGLENFLLTGYATAAYQDPEGADNPLEIGKSTFGATFNPVFLWTIADGLIFEGELEVEQALVVEGAIEDAEAETEVELEYAQIAYFLHDYVTIGVGKFLLPFDIWSERLHPGWINKLPTAPLPFQHHGGIAPMADVGVQVRGGIPIFDDVKMNYAVYLTNGPILLTEGHHAGELRFDNSEDINDNKAVGGRIGLLPIPELEVGFSYMRADVDNGGFEDVDAHIYGVDVSYVREADLIGGNVDIRFEYVKQDIDNAIYVVNATPFDFDNEKWGWYAQIAYRPTLLDVPILPNLEAVFRYTRLDWPSGTPLREEEPGDGIDKQQFSIGLNYWITPSAVLKIAYDINDNLDGPVDADNFFTVQAAYGF